MRTSYLRVSSQSGEGHVGSFQINLPATNNDILQKVFKISPQSATFTNHVYNISEQIDTLLVDDVDLKLQTGFYDVETLIANVVALNPSLSLTLSPSTGRMTLSLDPGNANYVQISGRLLERFGFEDQITLAPGESVEAISLPDMYNPLNNGLYVHCPQLSSYTHDSGYSNAGTGLLLQLPISDTEFGASTTTIFEAGQFEHTYINVRDLTSTNLNFSIRNSFDDLIDPSYYDPSVSLTIVFKVESYI